MHMDLGKFGSIKKARDFAEMLNRNQSLSISASASGVGQGARVIVSKTKKSGHPSNIRK